MTMVSYLDKSLYPSAPVMPHTPGGPVAAGPLPGDFKTPPVGYQPDQNRQISGVRFKVAIDGYDLGLWTKVDGLSVKFEIAEHRAGDGRNRRWIEPAYTTFTNLKLTRATTLKYSAQILKWLQDTSFTSKKFTGSIIAYPAWHKESESFVVEWRFRGILPVAWSGPQFDAGGGNLAMETLELAHEGFLDPEL